MTVSIEEEVLARERPTAEQRAQLQRTVERLTAAVEERMERLGVEGRPIVVGSAFKDTFLWPAEIDLFVALPTSTSREDLRRIGLSLGEVLEDRETRYAEHPYTRGTFDGLEAEVVPCYDLKDASEKMSAVDRTPFHAAYVVERLTDEGKDGVRLLKRFMKGVGVYGAEAKVEGFSGYMVELLVLAYGSFRGCLEAATRWRPQTVVPLGEGPSKEFGEPLVLVDPVDASRNVASAVSMEAMAVFSHAAQEYLADPRMEFFYPNERPVLGREEALRVLRERGTSVVGVVFEEPDVVDDVLYPQLRKAERAITDLLRRHDFHVLRSVSVPLGDRDAILLELGTDTLPLLKVHTGPPVGSKNVGEFLAKWRGHERALGVPHIQGGRWVVDIRRQHTDAKTLLETAVETLSLGKDVGERVAAGYRVLSGEDIVDEAILPGLTALVDHRFPWEF